MPDGLEGNGELDCEVAAVQAGRGHGYVELHHADLGRRVLLLERLGRAIVELDLTVDDRIDGIAETVARGWAAPLPAEIVRTGADQADFLDRFIAVRWHRLGEPCSEHVIRAARRGALARRDAFEPDRAVLVHGDAHATNVLEDPASPGRCKLIDPDAMRSEPAHDLGIVIRDERAALLREATPAETVGAWCERLAALCDDVDPPAIWDWALAERVSTGLFLLELGDDGGHDLLAVAAALIDG
jgi:streptomycin 6-kinase